MNEEKWTRIATEMQKHISALCEIAAREHLETVNIGLHGDDEKYYSRSHAFYIDESGVHYGVNSYSDGKVEINKDCKPYVEYEPT